METLKLVALDMEDLAVISAHLQDGVARIGDMTYLPKERRFAFAIRRFDWEAPEGGEQRRRLTAVHFERVLSVRTKGVDRASPDGVLNLLAITFTETIKPSGVAALLFSDGGTIELDLECIEMQMKDMGPVWETAHRPTHLSSSIDG